MEARKNLIILEKSNMNTKLLDCLLCPVIRLIEQQYPTKTVIEKRVDENDEKKGTLLTRPTCHSENELQ
jgi:hypothetical protein